MNSLAHSIIRYLTPIRLAKILPRGLVDFIKTISFIVTLFGFLSSILLVAIIGGNPIIDLVGAIAYMSFGVWTATFMISCYHNSYYYHGFTSVIGSEERHEEGTTYDVADVVRRKPDDLTDAFLTSPLGSMIMLRVGIEQYVMQEFLSQPRQKITAEMVPIKEGQIFSLMSVASFILQQDKEFKKFLGKHAIDDVSYLGAVNWVIGDYYTSKAAKRWWGKDNLSKTEGIGREWSYGTTYNIEKFSKDIRTSAVFSTLTRDSAYANEKILQIEHTLGRAKAANVLLLGEPGVGKVDLLIEVARRMKKGSSLDSITGKHMIVLDTDKLFASFKEKQEFELAFISLLTEAAKAGNIIVVIENISSFIRQSEAMNVMVSELMDQYLASPEVQFVCTDTPRAHHAYLETIGAFTRRFEEILIDAPDLSSTTRVLQGIAMNEERKYKSIFTFQSLKAITEAADRYIVDGVMPDKAISLLIDVATYAKQNNKIMIDSDFVYTVVSDKTGIPTGPIKEEERDLLLDLENRLHQRVIGQEKAIDAIARTMRRSRAGIQRSDRPIGSFLFLGPTGVGKTETAKALAFVFFKGEEHMHRIDMSEFSGPDALERLIGDGTRSGVLSDMLQEHPYSVVLLDEFEKSNTEVHDLFLQILDEGIFTDARGIKVNARNTIIIATSNAGSDLIMKTVKQRGDIDVLNKNIIDHIIEKGIYRPELINRFDSAIIFEPLTIEEQGSVASLMLGDLYERIKDRGYDLQLGSELINLVVQKGYSPEFGARPMQRVIQDLIEEKVAQKIISGEAQKGDSIILTKDDFTDVDFQTAA